MKEKETDTQYRINLSQLKEGVTEIDLRVTKELFDSTDTEGILDADVNVALDIEKRPGSFLLNIGCEGWLEVPCDRCLEPVRVPVDTDYPLTIKYGDEADDSADNLLVLPWEEAEADLAPVIRDTLLLEIPIRVVHPEGQCNPETWKPESSGDGEEE